jgi:signal transduction histidine kinase
VTGTRADRNPRLAVSTAVAGVVFGVIATAVSWSQSVPDWWVEAALRGGGFFAIVGGLVVWLRYRSPRIGQLLLAMGVVYYAGDFRVFPNQAVFAVAFWLTYAFTAVIGHLVLVWPTGYAATRFTRVMVPVCYVAAIGTQIGRYFADHPGPPWWHGHTGENTAWAKIGSFVQVVLVLVVIVYTIVRWTALTRPKRRPIAQVGVAFVLAAVLTACAGIASLVGAPKFLELTFIVAAMGAGVLGVLFVLVIRAALDQLEQIRTSRLRVVKAAFDERRMLYGYLHDDAQQKLFAILGWLAMAKQALATPDGNEAARNAVDIAHSQLNTAIKNLRDLAQGIYPTTLVAHGLSAAVEGLADLALIPVSFDIPDERWPEHVEISAYFIVAEAMTNSYKHAGATRVDIEVEHKPDRVVVHVADDGRGGADVNSGTGLRGLQDRVAAVGGDLAITSVPGRGTRVTANIPLEVP